MTPREAVALNRLDDLGSLALERRAAADSFGCIVLSNTEQ
jgi:hypothetical protein